MSPLTGAQKASLIDALLSGYTSGEQLAELLDLHLDVKLDEITEDGRGPETGGNSGNGGNGGGITKDGITRNRPRLPATLRFTGCRAARRKRGCR